MDSFDNSVFPHLFTVSMALPSRLIQHNSNDITTPSSSSRSIRHYNNNATTPSRFTIGTFNVRGLSSATKRNQLSEDLGRLHIDICCLQETKCPGGFDEHPGNYRLIGLQSQSRHYGLAFAVASHMEDRIVSYWSESDRIALIQLRLARNSLLTIINVYGPTSQRVNNNNAEQDEFFSDLAHLTSQYMSCALFYIAGVLTVKSDSENVTKILWENTREAEEILTETH